MDWRTLPRNQTFFVTTPWRKGTLTVAYASLLLQGLRCEYIVELLPCQKTTLFSSVPAKTRAPASHTS